MKFIVDTQLPPRLASYLRSKGYDSVHTTDFDHGHLLTDKDIILIATTQNRTVITKDSDFLNHFFLRGAPPKVLLLQVGNIRNADLFHLFDMHLDKVIAVFKEGSELVIFDRDGITAY